MLSIDSLFEGSDCSDEDEAKEKESSKKQCCVFQKKKARVKETNVDNSIINGPHLPYITHDKNGVKKSRVRQGIGKAYFVMEKSID